MKSTIYRLGVLLLAVIVHIAAINTVNKNELFTYVRSILKSDVGGTIHQAYMYARDVCMSVCVLGQNGARALECITDVR